MGGGVWGGAPPPPPPPPPQSSMRQHDRRWCWLEHRSLPCTDTPALHRHHRGHVYCMGTNVPVPKLSNRLGESSLALCSTCPMPAYRCAYATCLCDAAVWCGVVWRAGGWAGGWAGADHAASGPASVRARSTRGEGGGGRGGPGGQASGILTHNRHRDHPPTTTCTTQPLAAPHPQPTTTHHPPPTPS